MADIAFKACHRTHIREASGVINTLRQIIQGLTALEMGPRGDADVTSNIFEAVQAGPIVCHAAAPPVDGRPLLHIAAPHHQLTQPAIRKVRCRQAVRPSKHCWLVDRLSVHLHARCWW